MARPKRDNDLAARAIVWANFHGEAQACAKYNIALRTLQNYKKLVATDEELAKLYINYLELAQKRTWGDELDYSIKEILVSVRESLYSLESQTTSHEEQVELLKIKLQFLNTLLEPGMARELLFGEQNTKDVKQTATVTA